MSAGCDFELAHHSCRFRPQIGLYLRRGLKQAIASGRIET
jgi:hypothetical protein